MSENTQHPTSLPRRIFGIDDSPSKVVEEFHGVTGSSQQVSGGRRVSFSNVHRRPSVIGRWRTSTDDEEAAAISPSPRPAIPSALQAPGEVYTTPLPVLSMIVLSITMLGEFLSANVSAPFILFMVDGFRQFPDEARVGYWTGILASTFFLTQFLTSLLWATVAAKHGQRIVLFISLLGSAITCCLFGTSTSIQQAVAIRLMQGIFAGAIGVARGCVTLITDQSNEGRAYAILGFCWGFGGVAGAIVGGTFESPAQKWPRVFGEIPMFIQYPYLLPCIVAASITFIGSILCLFLGPDGGPREGAIRLPEKMSTIPEEDPTPITPPFEEMERQSLCDSWRRRLSDRLSGYFAKRVSDTVGGPSSPPQVQQDPVPLLLPTPPRTGKQRTVSQTSRANGSAYGYSGTHRIRLSGAVSTATPRTSMAMSIRRRRESNADGRYSSVATVRDLNFAQRLLMANEGAVTNIADLWVAAAMNVDNEDPFESESDVDVNEERESALETTAEPMDELEEDVFGSRPLSPTPRNDRFSRRESHTSIRSLSKRPVKRPGSPRQSSASGRLSLMRHRSSQYSTLSTGDETLPRRVSTTIPPIFSHVGVRTPPAVVEAQQLLAQLEEPSESLAPIMESQRTSQGQISKADEFEKEPSLMSQLPVLIIIQYGLLALHSTTHDQVFYLYLVSKYPLGGLNLNAGHFSQLIALMCLAQIAYQFYLYPNIGPPRGRFSHLAMFRIGSLLFIPSYLSVILYRVFASADNDGNPVLMAALAFSTAVRFCGSTFAYTAVSVLLNYMSPPHIVGFANGIAQSFVSLARFFGPILGGTVCFSLIHAPS
ncbi:hypothetical protein AcW1_009544 [Taiwanofungus camphoratus]|nr:hypothetical protein AcV5_002555 [Antrodia cinnamomea]KAI0942148.1 hypothetical protein AcV7_002662 [Antrodia cinnamomea]KAI0947902.1 hypothetical protein AcW1_009544 [Antrodia cinnamomea]